MVTRGRSRWLKHSLSGGLDERRHFVQQRRCVGNRDARSCVRPERLACGSVAEPDARPVPSDAPEIAVARATTVGTRGSAPSAGHGRDRSARSSSERAPTPSTTPESERLVTHSIGTATRRRFKPYEVISPRTRCESGSRTSPSTRPISTVPKVISAPTSWSSCAAVDFNMTPTRPAFACR
jgi:hypothetical protein